MGQGNKESGEFGITECVRMLVNERYHLLNVLKIDTNTYCLRKDHDKIKKK